MLVEPPFAVDSLEDWNAMLHSSFCSSCRGFKVKGKKEMVILRVTDTVLAEGHDITRRADDITRKTMAMISAGLNKVEGMVKEYVSMTSEEKSENL